MDYSRLRRSTNVEDNRASGLTALWNEIRPDIPSWDELKTMVEHPATPARELFRKKIHTPPPVEPGSMEDQAGASALPTASPYKGDREDLGGKGDRLDRPSYLVGNGEGAALPTAAAPKGGGMRPEVVNAITRAATEAGEDPAFALAVAERESSGDPNAHSSKSIYGIYQMTGNLRQQYGAGDSSDPYTQAKGWMGFIGDTRKDMASRLGRDPTPPELYLAHHFGPDRAARMVNGSISPGMATSDVFSPYEMSINPHFGRAGTVGNLTGSITGDINARMSRYSGATRPEPIDFAEYGQSTGGAGPSLAAPNMGSTSPISASAEPMSRLGSAFTRNQAWTKPGVTSATNFNTDLGDQEPQFRQWVKDNKVPFDPAASNPQDYDMRGFWKGLQNGDPMAKSAINPNDNALHYPDYWKTPYHETFSNESQWADPAKAPRWNDQDQLVTPSGQTLFDDRAQRPGTEIDLSQYNLAAPTYPPGP